MQLPTKLQEAIEQLAQTVDFKRLKAARAEQTEDYRGGASSKFSERDQMISYLITRMPATFAACYSVFKEIRARLPFSPRSIVDLGAGPGTATWAALEAFEDLSELHLIERELGAIEMGKKLSDWTANWQRASLAQCEIPAVDLAVLSYAYAETEDMGLIDKLWEKQIPVIAVIEPGTPKGFERIRAIRQHAIEKGAHLIAPCPHAAACPMSGDDWCHFSARVERTRLHRLLKEGSLGYEDEKYSYIVFSTMPIAPIQGRVIRHPQKGSGHVRLQLCASSGQLEQTVVTRSNKESYRAARDAEWGTAWM